MILELLELNNWFELLPDVRAGDEEAIDDEEDEEELFVIGCMDEPALIGPEFWLLVLLVLLLLILLLLFVELTFAVVLPVEGDDCWETILAQDLEEDEAATAGGIGATGGGGTKLAEFDDEPLADETEDIELTWFW